MELIFIVAAALAILAILFVAYVAYENHSLDVRGKHRSLGLYILGAILSGILVNGLIAHFVVDQVCSGLRIRWFDPD